MDLWKGALLAAMPTLLDPNFSRTVVLVCDLGPDGALGLVLNRPTEVPVLEHLPTWRDRLANPPVVFIGGPVQPDNAVGLGSYAEESPPGWVPVVGSIGLVDLGKTPGSDPGAPAGVRVFSGYAGWGPGQLEAEVAAGDWAVVESHPGDIFREDPAGLWHDVFRRQPGRLAFYGVFPVDPRLN